MKMSEKELKRVWEKKLAKAAEASLRGKRVLCAFNAFIDRIVFIQPKKINELIAREGKIGFKSIKE